MILAVDANGAIAKFWHGAGGGPNTKAGSQVIDIVNLYCELHPSVTPVFAFDSFGNNFRKSVYAGYKAKRPKPDQDYIDEIEATYSRLKNDGCHVFRVDGFEADDIIASLVSKTSDKVVIFSQDKDFNQLLEKGRVTILKRASKSMGKIDCEYFTEDNFASKFGIKPTEWVKFQCLAGDASDGWPGASGVGPVTALAYLKGETVKQAKLDAIGALDWGVAESICKLRRDVDLVGI